MAIIPKQTVIAIFAKITVLKIPIVVGYNAEVQQRYLVTVSGGRTENVLKAQKKLTQTIHWRRVQN